jgi:predicted lipoprotein with Yx(FWY)xxD motif
MTMRVAVSFAVAAALLAVASARATDSAAPDAARATPLVTTFKHPTFGRVLARRDGQALYDWHREQRDFRVRCTGACARAWPPVIVPRGVLIQRRIRGIRGTFGIVRRPDGRRQLTHNQLPLYAYAHERPRQVLCNNVDGWFVVRA